MTARPHKNHSFSRLDTAANICERQYALEAIFPTPFGNDATDRGSHVHAGLEAWMQAKIWGKDGFTAALQADSAKKLPGKNLKYFLPGDEFANYMERMRPFMDRVEPIAVEQWFRSCAGLPIVGKMDLLCKIDGVIYIIDYKTTGKPHNIKTLAQSKKSLQLKIYCLAAEVNHAGFVFMLPSGEPQERLVEFKDKDLNLTKRWLTSQLEVLESKWSHSKGAGPEETKGYDMSLFSLAAPGHPLCCKKWCDHWARCLGA